MTLTPLLQRLNIAALTPMQEASLSTLPVKNNVLLLSPTGSGKTLAYLLPLLNLLEKNNTQVQVLIIVPSRELALQIEQVSKQLLTGFKVNAFYGGHSTLTERHSLSEPPAVLIATPGRLCHHLRKKSLQLDQVKVLILDEFDKSLEAGFEEEMAFVIKHLRRLQKQILTSATRIAEMPKFIRTNDLFELDFSESKVGSKSLLQQTAIQVPPRMDKSDALLLLLGKVHHHSSLVFCNRREEVQQISDRLQKEKIPHGIYHGGLEQNEREKVLIRLRNGSVTLLITTDLAARGLDIPDIENVIHLALPLNEETLVHRNGRTARMQASGHVFYLLDGEDTLPASVTAESGELPKAFKALPVSEWKTLYFSAGKKDKVNKMDIVGMLLQKGGIQKDELGKIDVLDHQSYAAVKSKVIHQLLNKIANEKIKNKKVKMEIAS